MVLGLSNISQVKFAAGGILVPFRGRYLVDVVVVKRVVGVLGYVVVEGVIVVGAIVVVDFVVVV
jgi:hypothetical protein